MSTDTMVDGVESYIRKAKEQLADVRKSGETGRELSLVMTKLDEAELWIRAYREKKEAGSHEAC